MKCIILFLGVCFSSFTYSQDKICFKTLEHLKETASGNWKIADAQSNQFYRISFNKNNKPLLETLEDLDFVNNRPGSKYDLAFRDKATLAIEYFDDCYSIGIETKAKFGSVFDELKFLSERQFVFKNNRYRLVKF
ncbi:hypothetical protein RM697_06575 [Ichthyenterobacterium sp. W332]|uniref:Uncharacterized protein n=1 Tax=Microcosmobacter mediterraneus TaxID=3075607 RepID=A0ABU2YJH1_9FLAO|nr:hypothetical protein [Ichthyenterobacterium sp. W332]MDT0558301.1 hypothetical protein [Ichthyenterobacterium sp. W332]